MTKQRDIERDQAIYDMFRAGKKYGIIAHEFNITDSGVKQALARHRKLHNLPKGRKLETA